MAPVYAGEVLGVRKPAAGETTELMVYMQDSAGVPLTGQTFDAAGMEIYISKPGAADVIWATIVGAGFVIGNWSERGHGKYVIILSGDVAGEANLCDTPGDLAVYVKNTASKGDNFLFRVVPADVARDDQWTDGRAVLISTIPTDVAAAILGTPANKLVTDTSGRVDFVDNPNEKAISAIQRTTRLVSLSVTSQYWNCMAIAPGDHMYAGVGGGGTGDVYYQEVAGIGPLLPLGEPARNCFGMATPPDGSAYVCVYNDRIYKRPATGGPFQDLNQTVRPWRKMAAHPGGNVYACTGPWSAAGRVYVQTAGAGDFVDVGSDLPCDGVWYGMACPPDGSVYVCEYGHNSGDIWKRPPAGGAFVRLNQTPRDWSAMAAHPNGDVYAVAVGWIYKQTGGVGDFLIQTPLGGGWTSVAVGPDGNLYGCVQNGSIYLLATLTSIGERIITYLDAAVTGREASGAAAVAVGMLNNLSAQNTRDAMKLAPAAGNPEPGSVDAHLDDAALETTLTAIIGSGLRTVTVSIQNEDGDFLEGVVVSITNQAETSDIAGPRTTDENGQVQFHLNDGADYRAIPRSTVIFSGGATNFAVSGATPVTCIMEQVAIPTPSDPSKCAVHGYLYHPIGGQPLASVENAVIIRPATVPLLGDGQGFTEEEGAADTDDDGYFCLSVVRSTIARDRGLSDGIYRLSIPSIRLDRRVIIPDLDACLFTDLQSG
jgi:hypothetical protein